MTIGLMAADGSYRVTLTDGAGHAGAVADTPAASGANATITSLAATKTLSQSSPAQPADATKAHIQVFGANVAYTLDGTTPSASNGLVAQPSDIIVLGLAEMNTVKIIQLAASATLQIYYSK